MILNPKATIISVFFGNLPYYFDFTKKTIQHNTNYQWIIAGDMFAKKEEKENILFLPYNLDNLSEDCSRILNSKIKINTPYKTCDVRPLFPEIFDLYISSDWVGWADLDCIFGDLDTFITPEVLNNYDVFSYMAKSVYDANVMTPHGPFTLFNNKKIKQWYLKIPNLVSKINFQSTDSAQLRSSSQYLDELAFGEIISQEGYKVCSKYKPYDNRSVELPIIFNGRRRLPARWKEGKIYVDSVKEDYDNRFNDLHSLFLHIRGNAYVDVEKCEIIPEAMRAYIDKSIINVYLPHTSIYTFIKDHIPTIKFLHKKNPNIIFSFEQTCYKRLEYLIKLFASEININISTVADNELIKCLHLTQIPPSIIDEMRTSVSNKNFPDKVCIRDENCAIKTDLTAIYNIKDLKLEDLLSLFAYSSEIHSNVNFERNLLILMRPDSIYKDQCPVENASYENIFKQLLSLTAKKRNYLKTILNYSQNCLTEKVRLRSYKEENLDLEVSPDLMLYENVLLDPTTGMCITSQEEITPVSKACYINNWEGNKKSWIRGVPDYAKDKSVVVNSRLNALENSKITQHIKTKTVKMLDSSYTYVNLLGSTGSYAYGHLLDATLKIFNLPDINNPCFLISPHANIKDLDSIIKIMCGWENVNFQIIDPKDICTYKIPKLWELKQVNGFVNFGTVEQYNKFTKVFIQKITIPNKRHKIFLARKSPLQRHIINFDEIYQELINNDITVITGNETFLERVALMSNCSHVSGYHGALFLDTCFCPEDTNILEYVPVNRPARCFMRMYKNCKNYYIKTIDTEPSLNCVLNIEELLSFYQ